MILMNDFTAEPPSLLREEMAAAERVLKSGWFILGKEVQQFEHAWAEFCGSKFAVGVANGMDAIEIGLRALDIGSGDEVITTPMTAMATVLAILRAGARPVFADINPETALLDLKTVAGQVTPRTKAVLLVHLYGRIDAMHEWVNFCHSNNIHLLEDCAQSHGAKYCGKLAGTFGAWGAYSFYPTKNLGGRGDGGALITNSEAVCERARQFRNYGQSKRYHHPERGLNSRLDELQAAILSARLQWFERFNEMRRCVAERYFAEIRNPKLRFLQNPSSREQHVHHLFVARCAERDRLASFLKEHGVESLIHYPIPAHRQPPCKDFLRSPLPQAEAHAAECLSIPCHPQLAPEQVDRVIHCLNQFA